MKKVLGDKNSKSNFLNGPNLLLNQAKKDVSNCFGFWLCERPFTMISVLARLIGRARGTKVNIKVTIWILKRDLDIMPIISN